MLECYLRRNLRINGGLLDEVHFLMHTDKPGDKRWLSDMIESSGLEKHYKRKAEDTSGDWDLWKSYPNLYRDFMTDPDTLYIKIDDDLVSLVFCYSPTSWSSWIRWTDTALCSSSSTTTPFRSSSAYQSSILKHTVCKLTSSTTAGTTGTTCAVTPYGRSFQIGKNTLAGQSAHGVRRSCHSTKANSRLAKLTLRIIGRPRTKAIGGYRSNLPTPISHIPRMVPAHPVPCYTAKRPGLVGP